MFGTPRLFAHMSILFSWFLPAEWVLVHMRTSCHQLQAWARHIVAAARLQLVTLIEAAMFCVLSLIFPRLSIWLTSCNQFNKLLDDNIPYNVVRLLCFWYSHQKVAVL